MIRADDANRNEESEHASWSRSHEFRHYYPPPGGFLAHTPHQEAMHQEAIPAGYRIPPPDMQNFPPPAMPLGSAYYPPAGGAQDTLIAEFRAFQKAQAERTLKENQVKEASMYERLGRATAAATAISFQGTFSPTGEGLHGMQTDYCLAQQSEATRTLREKEYREYLMYMQLEQAKASASASTTSFPGEAHDGRSHVAPYFGRTYGYTGGTPPAPYQNLPPLYHQPEANYPQHRGSISTAASAQTNNTSSPPGSPLRQHPTEPASRGKVRHPIAKATKQPTKKKLCRFYLKSSKLRNFSADKRIVPNKAGSADV
jgi:hypothetical protein